MGRVKDMPMAHDDRARHAMIASLAQWQGMVLHTQDIERIVDELLADLAAHRFRIVVDYTTEEP